VCEEGGDYSVARVGGVSCSVVCGCGGIASACTSTAVSVVATTITATTADTYRTSHTATTTATSNTTTTTSTTNRHLPLVASGQLVCQDGQDQFREDTKVRVRGGSGCVSSTIVAIVAIAAM